jgi:hypothetical protein
MCIGFGAWENCLGGEACIELETSGMACEEVQLVLDGSWTAELDWAFELGLEAVIDGWEIAGWSFEESWSADGVISDTLTLCVPPACFDVFWGWDAASVDVEALLVSVLIAGMDPVALFDWFEPFNDGGFGLLPDCMDAVSTPELNDEAILFWPNPAQSHVRWQLPAGSGNGWLEVFDAGGRMVQQQVVQSTSGSWDVSGWPVGMYTVTWTGDDRHPIRAKILVLR